MKFILPLIFIFYSFTCFSNEQLNDATLRNRISMRIDSLSRDSKPIITIKLIEGKEATRCVIVSYILNGDELNEISPANYIPINNSFLFFSYHGNSKNFLYPKEKLMPFTDTTVDMLINNKNLACSMCYTYEARTYIYIQTESELIEINEKNGWLLPKEFRLLDNELYELFKEQSLLKYSEYLKLLF